MLGPMEALDRGRLLPLGGRRQRALLALLLLHRDEVVTTDRLIDELWGERPPANAAKVLHVYVSRLRKSLHDGDPAGTSSELLLTTAGGYRLHVEPGALDSQRFLELAADGRRALAAGDPDRAAALLDEALSLWRGLAFADVAYEPFVQSEIARLEESRLGALEDRLEADLARGRDAAAVGELQALLADNPLRERLAAQLMLALYRSGRQAEALEVFQRTRKTLVDELGLEPGEQLRGLQEAILRQDPELRPRGAPPPASVSRPRGRVRGLAVATALVSVLGVAALVVLLTRGSAAATRIEPNSVAAIDPRTGRLLGSVAVGSRPAALSFGDGALWVANLDDESVSRIDPHTRRVVRTIPTGESPAGLAAGRGGVWVASPNGSLRMIDPRYDAVRTVATGSRGYLSAVDLPSPAIAGAGSIWVVNKTAVERIDPATGRVVASIAVGLSPTAMAIGDGSIWVADSAQDTVTRIDTVTNTSSTTPVGHGASGIAVGAGAVWVADSSDDAVVRVDPETNAVTDTIPVGRDPTGIAFAGDSVWVANSASGTVSRIDPTTRRVVQTKSLGNSPVGVTFAAGRLWVSVDANALGEPTAGLTTTARFDLPTDADMLSLDPALADASDPWQIEYATCAKLLNYPDAAGKAGLLPRPEVAAAEPRISANGRTYTLRIRSGFRFSPPSDAPVTAQTFRATIERTLNPQMHSPIAPFMHVADVRALGSQLTIRLKVADPTLLVKLAMPYFCAVPAGTPANPAGVPGIPSAGPYYVSSYVPGQEIIVRRNPNYRGARPHRIAEFRYTIGMDPGRSVKRIESGQADYLVSTVADVLPYADNAGLLARYGPGSSASRAGRQQYFVNPTPEPLLIWLNTSRPIFAHVNLRKALSYAIDRAALIQEIEQSGGPVFVPTDQYLTPGMPGSEPVDVYPLEHPDLAIARRLAGPGRHGTAVFLSGVFDPQSDQIVAHALQAIGIKVVIERLPLNALFAEEHTADAPFDLVTGGTGIDYPDPFDILNTELDGNLITAHQNDNVSNFNDPVYNRELEAAAKLSGPSRYDAYARLDADLVRNAAPMVAFANGTSQDFFSSRIGCQTYQPVFGMDITALCLRH